MIEEKKEYSEEKPKKEGKVYQIEDYDILIHWQLGG